MLELSIPSRIEDTTLYIGSRSLVSSTRTRASRRTLRPLYPRKRTWSGMRRMSAKCQKATFALAANCGLFDHIIRTQQERFRNLQIQGFCSLKIDGQLKFCRPFHGYVYWFIPLQNLCNKHCTTSKDINFVGPVRQQTTYLDEGSSNRGCR